jgi:hypothetical protein
LVLLVVTWAAAADSDRAPRRSDSLPAKPGPTYEVKAGLDGEIFPVFANYASLQQPEQRHWATVTVKVRNSGSDPLRNRIAVEVPGWSDREIQVAEIAAGEMHTYQFAPSFLPRLYHNHEITAATAVVTVSGGGQELYSTTVPVRLRSVEDMYWGHDFENAPYIAAWITPHDERVERVLARAKEFMPGRRLPGYEDDKSEAVQEQSTVAQARAIFRALQEQGVSYVKSSLTLGAHQDWSERVRLPRESLARNSANCIDGALLYASLFENLGMDSVIALVPGHAYVGVRLTAGSDRFLYLETAYTGRSSFEAAMNAAQHNLARYRRSDITFVHVDQARQAGIFPMPE